MLDALARALGGERATPTASTWSASSPRSTPASRARAATIKFLRVGDEAESDGSQADPRRRRGGRARAAVRLPRGHLPHLRREALLRAGSRHAQREGVRHRGRDGPHLHQRRPKATDRDRAMSEETHDHAPDRKPAGPPDRRADRGARQGVRRDPRRGLRRPRRPRPPLHHQHDRDAPPARGARPRAAARLAPPARLDRRDHRELARRRSSRTWRSATTSCTGSGTG